MPVARTLSVLVLCALLAACGAGPAPRSVVPTRMAEPTRSVEPVENPAGWRWESFGGVQVAVPGDWGWGVGGQRLSQWCISTSRDRAEPIVGRPGAVTAVGCSMGEDGVDPRTLLENTGSVVSLDWVLEEKPGTTHEGDSTTVVLAGVAVTVVAPADLRERIVATVHEVQGPRDAFGCPTTDPVWTDPGRRPDPGVDVATLSGVSAVSVCRYAVADPAARFPGDREPLFSSARLAGDAARDVLAAIAAAPPGGGPDNPGDCLPDYSYGDDLIVLRVTSDAGESTVHARYSGCDHNGFDDGVTVRRLTREAMQPLLAGPNRLLSFSGREEKRRILQP